MLMAPGGRTGADGRIGSDRGLRAQTAVDTGRPPGPRQVRSGFPEADAEADADADAGADADWAQAQRVTVPRMVVVVVPPTHTVPSGSLSTSTMPARPRRFPWAAR